MGKNALSLPLTLRAWSMVVILSFSAALAAVARDQFRTVLCGFWLRMVRRALMGRGAWKFMLVALGVQCASLASLRVLLTSRARPWVFRVPSRPMVHRHVVV